MFLYDTNVVPLNEKQIEKKMRITNVTYHPTWFLKSEIYKNLEGYRDIPYCEDYDFVLRCLNKKYKIGKMDKNIVEYRMRKNGVSMTYSLEQYLNSKVINKLYKIGELENLNYTKKRLKIVKDEIIEEDKKLYIKADKNFNSAVRLIKKGRIVKGLKTIIKSFLLSKYYRRKYLDLIFYKLNK